MTQTLVRPPVNDPITTKFFMLSDIWSRYFNNLNTQLTNILTYGTPIPDFSTTERDDPKNSPVTNQTIIHNTTTNTLQINIGGSWLNISTTPA
jgi:hypothetical protein